MIPLIVTLPVKVVLKFVVATKRRHGPHTKGVWEKHLSRGVDPDLNAKRSFNVVEPHKEQVYPGFKTLAKAVNLHSLAFLFVSGW